MKFAAVDIGSNAIRFQVSTVLANQGQEPMFKKLEYVRFPLRLGHDVFSTGRISLASAEKFRKLMRAFKLLIELYEVTDYRFCATSAMRESENGRYLAQQIKDELDIRIDIIEGREEAELINKAITSYLGTSTSLHIDVGGGSTELNLYVEGKKINTRSFRIGSVRVLENNDSPEIWTEMQQWITTQVKREYGKVISIGTGGNISKIYELAGSKSGKTISLKKVKEVRDWVQQLSLEERIYRLQMNPDRADVIIPASNIYIQVMEWAHSTSILVPDVGLKDGILIQLFDGYRQREASQN